VDDLRLPAAPASQQVLRSARKKTASDKTHEREGTTG
jgi:hypothetical protein